MQQARSLSEQDNSRLAELAGELERDQPMLDQARATADSASAELQQSEQAMQAWQSEWDQFNQHANEPAQQAQVERTRINHLEDQETQLKRRLARNSEEQQQLSDVSLQAEINELQRREAEGEAGLQTVRERVESRVASISSLRERNQHTQEELAAARTEVQTLKGRLASLQALQQAARGEGDKSLARWLDDHGLAQARRLLETLDVSDDWQKAVEVVLAEQLQAVVVDDLNGSADGLQAIERGNLTLIESSGETIAPQPGTLAEQVRGPAALTHLLSSMHTVGSLDEALRRRSGLAPGECLVTPEGLRVGRGWLSLQRGADARAGVLAREQEIRELTQHQSELEPRVENLAQQLADDRQALIEAEQAREGSSVNLKRRSGRVRVRALLSGKQARAEQIRHRLEGLEKDAGDVSQQIRRAAPTWRPHDSGCALCLPRSRTWAGSAKSSYNGATRCASARQGPHRGRRGAQQGPRDRVACRIDAHIGRFPAVGNRPHGPAAVAAGTALPGSRIGTPVEQAPVGEQQVRLEQQLQSRAEVETQLADARKGSKASITSCRNSIAQGTRLSNAYRTITAASTSRG